MCVKYHPVLTKADLLPPRELAISYEVCASDARKGSARGATLSHAPGRAARAHATRSGRPSYAGGDMPMTSARTATGVAELWERMRLGVRHRVHELSPSERQQLFDGSHAREGAHQRGAPPLEITALEGDGTYVVSLEKLANYGSHRRPLLAPAGLRCSS